MLFQKRYWQMLLRGTTWHEARLSLRRVHKDKRARKHLLWLGWMLLIPVLCVAYLAWLAGTGAWLVLPLLAPIIWWQTRRAKEEATPLHIAPQPEREPTDRLLSEVETAVLRQFFAEMTLIYATLVARAGSERFLKEKILPEGFEVTSRRLHLDMLKTRGLWDKMARVDREAMMMPDGHWEWERINQVGLALEPLRLLRWLLRVDYYLPLIGKQLRGDYATAYELVRAPEKVLESKGLVDPATVRVGRNSAGEYYQRCVAEAITRGYYEASSDEAAQWAKAVAEGMGGKQHEDFVLGDKLVSEASKDDLLWAVSLSRRRRDFLSWVMAVMQGGVELEGEFMGLSEGLG